MAILDDPRCLEVLSNDTNIPTGARSIDGVNRLLQSTGHDNDYNNIVSNMTKWGVQREHLLSNDDTNNFNETSLVSFNLVQYISCYTKQYQLTGNQSVANKIVQRLDDVFKINDQSLVAPPVDIRVPNLNGGFGSILPYKAIVTPDGFDLNNASEGWSRWAPSFFEGTTNTELKEARARPEPLTDGIISYYVLRAIKTLLDGGLVTPIRAQDWTAKISRVLAYYDSQWKEQHEPQNGSMGPIDGNTTYRFSGQYFDNFDKNYPLNQQAIILAADMLYQSIYSDRTGVSNRAEKFIKDLNEYYIVSSSGDIQGWYYTMFLNCVETWEDLGHSHITFEFLKLAAEENIPNAIDTLTLMTRALVRNAYKGGGDWDWYNNGVKSHGSTNIPGPRKKHWERPEDTVPECYIGTTSQQNLKMPTAGHDGRKSTHFPLGILSRLPQPLSDEVKVVRQETMNLVTREQNLSSGQEIDAVLDYIYTLCDLAQCIDETDSRITLNVSTIQCGSDLSIESSINPSSGGMPGYFILIHDPDGNQAANPQWQTGSTWKWTAPNCSSSDCKNGTYVISIYPPSSSTHCDPWLGAASFELQGCN